MAIRFRLTPSARLFKFDDCDEVADVPDQPLAILLDLATHPRTPRMASDINDTCRRYGVHGISLERKPSELRSNLRRYLRRQNVLLEDFSQLMKTPRHGGLILELAPEEIEISPSSAPERSARDQPAQNRAGPPLSFATGVFPSAVIELSGEHSCRFWIAYHGPDFSVRLPSSPWTIPLRGKGDASVNLERILDTQWSEWVLADGNAPLLQSGAALGMLAMVHMSDRDLLVGSCLSWLHDLVEQQFARAGIAFTPTPLEAGPIQVREPPLVLTSFVRMGPQSLR